MGCGNSRNKQMKLKILVVGPEQSGKTTFLYCLDSIEDLGIYTPTENLHIYEIERPNHKLQFYEVGGSQNLRSQWYDNLHHCDAIIFFIDASDPERLSDGLEELKKLAHDKRTQSYPLFVYFNKIDNAPKLNQENTRKQANEILANRKTHHKVFFTSCLDKSKLDPTVDEVEGHFFKACVLMEPKRNSDSEK